ncbi:7356_t:CDS:2 [Acaulospora morrowiae]|uniref:7356_t:CDS:1 n=1 Tax=Acaulospora morrowiae TaxID=94023 RepID=A0A9N9F698_9GLOM|nr:7356_t:CDS:2 [Acaulospora morrowiae]
MNTFSQEINQLFKHPDENLKKTNKMEKLQPDNVNPITYLPQKANGTT